LPGDERCGHDVIDNFCVCLRNHEKAMSFFSNIFGPKRTKFGLIRDLIKERLREDRITAGMGLTPDMVDEQPDEVVIGTPEATVVTIIETYHALRDAGASLSEALVAIEQHRNQFIPGRMPISASLSTYISYRVRLEHADGPNLPPASIARAIVEATKFYKPEILKKRNK
jgi:hypothetical protein